MNMQIYYKKSAKRLCLFSKRINIKTAMNNIFILTKCYQTLRDSNGFKN